MFTVNGITTISASAFETNDSRHHVLKTFMGRPPARIGASQAHIHVRNAEMLFTLGSVGL